MRESPETFDMRDLEALVAIADTGSFTSAAQKLFLSQPTVSGRIADLEATLGAKLFDRGPGKVRLTPAGEVLLPRARALLRGREEAIQAVAGFLGRFSGTLRVGASSIPGSYLLPRLLSQLHARHPEMRIQLSVEDTDKTLEALRRGDVEIAVVGRSVDEPGLEEAVVGRDEIVLVATPKLAEAVQWSKKRGPGALESLPIVLREAGSATRAAALMALEAGGTAVDRLRVILEIGGNAGAREAALAGVGAAFLSRLVVEDQIASGRLILLSVFPEPLIRAFVLVTRAGRTLSPAAAELAKLLENHGRG